MNGIVAFGPEPEYLPSGMVGDVVTGQIARGDDGVIGVVGDVELLQLPLHGIGRPRRVGDEDDGAAALAVGVQCFAGFGKGFQAVMHHAPDIGEDHLDAIDKIAQPLDKTQRHDLTDLIKAR